MILKRLFRSFKNERERKVIDLLTKSLHISYRNLSLYHTALRHKSAARNIYQNPEMSNERLEFLGDAILDSVVAEYLFDKYPHAEEGELTQMKSRIVSRTSLNRIAKEMGVDILIETDAQAAKARDSLSGNALEALFGAIFIDLGYKRTRKAIMRMLNTFADLNKIEYQDPDFKSRLYEEAHKRKSDLVFDTRMDKNEDGVRTFKSEVYMNNNKLGEGVGSSKKRAEQRASQQGLQNVSTLDEED